ncbi:SGNH/GDSL hydrolase family protein [Chroococcidiopsis sp.]|uniref:SGNH/GDSL hydrolase family protein n=1 Tax=Chroococcidiopsis sp. TaxID=3088168 RepID=UPI003F359FF8
MLKIDQVKNLSKNIQPTLYALGDSFSTFWGTPNQTNAINGRANNGNGMNHLDHFSRAFNPKLRCGIKTNYAQSGAMLMRDHNPAPAWYTPTWGPTNLIPGGDTQLNLLIADNPIGTITEHDILAILLGTNDKNPHTGNVAVDGGASPTPVQVRDKLLSIINRAIAHGFKQIIYCYPESRYWGTLPGLLEPSITTLKNNDRSLKLIPVFLDSAMLESDNPWHDGLHPNDYSYERIAEIMVSQFLNQSWVDTTKNLHVSALGASGASPREIGFKNFNPNTNGTRLIIADQFNCIQAILNERTTWRSYNGLVINGAFETGNAVSGVGGGKNDPCLIVQGNFWEHQAIIRMDSVGGNPLSQSPYLLGRTGGVDRFKVQNNGTMIIATPNDTNGETVARFTTAAAKGRVNIETGVDASGYSNGGFGFRNNNTLSYSLAVWNPNPALAQYGCMVYNEQLSFSNTACTLYCDQNSNVVINAAQPGTAKLNVYRASTATTTPLQVWGITPVAPNAGSTVGNSTPTIVQGIDADGFFTGGVGKRTGWAAPSGTVLRTVPADITAAPTVAQFNQVLAILRAIITDQRTLKNFST